MPYDRASANRALAPAVLASVLAHALLLGVDWPQLKRSLARPTELVQPIVARLVEPPVPLVPPAPRARPSPPAPRAETPVKPRIEKKAPAPRPRPAPAPQKPAKSTQAPVLAAPPAPVPAPAPAPAREAVVEAKPSPVPAPPPEVSEERVKARYRAALLQEAQRHKRYPPLAVDNAWEGDVVVRVVIGADGALASLHVVSSSGHGVLDRRALEMFRRASARVAPPRALRGRQFAVDLRAVFRLEDQASG